MSPQRIRNIVLPLCAVLLAASCSTTRRLGSDEVLYTGVKKILIEPDSGVVLTPAAESAVKEPLSVAPNNPLYSPYLRTPLPVGLWAYNHLYTPKEKGFKYWFYKRLAKQPVLISKVQPQLRTKVAEQVLENYGYFGSRAADSLLYRKRNLFQCLYFPVTLANFLYNDYGFSFFHTTPPYIPIFNEPSFFTAIFTAYTRLARSFLVRIVLGVNSERSEIQVTTPG